MNTFSKAKWIWNGKAPEVNAYADFTESFVCSGDCNIKIACDGDYILYVNDVRIGFGQYKGYDDLQFYDEYCLTDVLKKGTNTLRAVVHHPGIDTSTYRKGTAGIIFEIVSDGEAVCFSSENTLTRVDPYYVSGDTVPMVTSQLGLSFELDMTAKENEFYPSVISNRSYDLEKRPVKKLDVGDIMPAAISSYGTFISGKKGGKPSEIMENAFLKTVQCSDIISLPSESGIMLSSDLDGCFAIIDLGCESTGILSLDIEVPETSELLVGWGEHLSDLRVRTAVGGRSFAARITLPKGRTKLENPLLRLGLRYLQINILSGSCKIYYAGIRPTEYPLSEPAPAPISDLLHKKIYDVCVRTLKLCMHEHYEDCPWREQALYSMDSRNQMLCGYYVFGETEFAKASIRLMAHSIREDDLLELCSPAKVSITIPSFSAMFIVQLCEYLEHSGDIEFVKEILPTAMRIADGFIARTDDNGLIMNYSGEGYWNFYEWQDGLDNWNNGVGKSEIGTYDAPLLGFVAMAYESLAVICEKAGNSRSEYYREKYNAVRSAAEGFWDENCGCYASYIKDEKRSHFCELTNSLLLSAGLVPEYRAEGIRKKLAEGKLIPVTLSHSIFKYEALLCDINNTEYVLSDIAEKWGGMLSSGATSFWETIDGERAFDNAGSLCHGWSAVPAYLYFVISKQGT